MTTKEVTIKLDLNKREAAQLENDVAEAAKKFPNDFGDERDTIMASLFTQIANSELEAEEALVAIKELSKDPFGAIIATRICGESGGLEAKIKDLWAKKHARLKAAINQVLNTYL